MYACMHVCCVYLYVYMSVWLGTCVGVGVSSPVTLPPPPALLKEEVGRNTATWCGHHCHIGSVRGVYPFTSFTNALIGFSQTCLKPRVAHTWNCALKMLDIQVPGPAWATV